MTMTRAQVEKEFKKLVADIFKVSVAKLKGSTNYAMDLRAKSLSMITLIAATESKFGIKTSPMETAKNTTIKKSVDYILKKLKQKK
jgi:acyl carrier protein